MPDAARYIVPEVRKNSWSTLKQYGKIFGYISHFHSMHRQDVHTADAYLLGLLLHSVFNPTLPLPPTSQPPHAPPQLSSRGAIPTSLFPLFKKLLNPSPKARLSAKLFLDAGNSEMTGDGLGFFSQNRMVKICSSLDNFSLNNEVEKSALLR